MIKAYINSLLVENNEKKEKEKKVPILCVTPSTRRRFIMHQVHKSSLSPGVNPTSV